MPLNNSKIIVIKIEEQFITHIIQKMMEIIMKDTFQIKIKVKMCKVKVYQDKFEIAS